MYLARPTHKNNLHINEQLNQYQSVCAQPSKTTSTVQWLVVPTQLSYGRLIKTGAHLVLWFILEEFILVICDLGNLS